MNKETKKLMFSSFKEDDLEDFLPMAALLWKNYFSSDSLVKEFKRIVSSQNEIGYFCRNENESIGFITMSIRFDHVPKALYRPVGYMEGIFVKKEYRNLGIAKKLYELGEKWVKSKGCTQMGSDTWDWNKDSILFHEKLGFQKGDTLVHFIKNI